MHEALESPDSEDPEHRRSSSFAAAIVMIVAIDIVFSLDSTMAVIGMSNELWIMATAVIVGSIVLLVASGPTMRFINQHPTVKMLALAFVLLIGVALVADGVGFEIPRGYLYFAIVFSVLVEGLNIAMRRRHGRIGGHGLAQSRAERTAERAYRQSEAAE
jgi:predicted tellurium resistance membrane protein TerC